MGKRHFPLKEATSMLKDMYKFKLRELSGNLVN